MEPAIIAAAAATCLWWPMDAARVVRSAQLVLARGRIGDQRMP
jgi:hypothetical protein